MTPLRTAVVGLGKQARDDHLPALMQSTKYDLVGVCDQDPQAVEDIGLHYRVARYTDLHEMLTELDFQVALVSVPHHAYIDIVTALVEANKHIIKEKPFATSIEEARRLLDILRQGSVYLGITVQRRFNPIYRTFHQLKQYRLFRVSCG